MHWAGNEFIPFRANSSPVQTILFSLKEGRYAMQHTAESLVRLSKKSTWIILAVLFGVCYFIHIYAVIGLAVLIGIRLLVIDFLIGFVPTVVREGWGIAVAELVVQIYEVRLADQEEERKRQERIRTNKMKLKGELPPDAESYLRPVRDDEKTG